jgi:hypothetical protein
MEIDDPATQVPSIGEKETEVIGALLDQRPAVIE